VPPTQPDSAVSSTRGSGLYPDCPDPEVGRVGFPGTPPILIKKVTPVIETHLRGTVIVEAIIDRQGAPCSVRVIRSLAPDEDRAAVNAVKQWRFVPAKVNGKAAQVAFSLSVRIRGSGESER
jgi:protein TonB